MRIIAGSHKGARIFAPKGRGHAPDADRVREAAFNLIGPVDGAAVLDLFAGSGAMGLEALSRGAASAVFVENDRDARRTIDRNLDKLGLTGARVVARTPCELSPPRPRLVAATISCWSIRPTRCFLPAKQAFPVPSAVLAEDGLVVVETGARDEPELPPLSKRTSRRYGSARITLFEHP